MEKEKPYVAWKGSVGGDIMRVVIQHRELLRDVVQIERHGFDAVGGDRWSIVQAADPNVTALRVLEAVLKERGATLEDG